MESLLKHQQRQPSEAMQREEEKKEKITITVAAGIGTTKILPDGKLAQLQEWTHPKNFCYENQDGKIYNKVVELVEKVVEDTNPALEAKKNPW